MEAQKTVLYEQKRISENGHKGWRFTYALVLGKNTVSTQREKEVWEKDKKEAYNTFTRVHDCVVQKRVTG